MLQSTGMTISNAPGTSISNSGISEVPVSPQQSFSDKICFNFGKELYVYSYRGLKKVKISFFFFNISRCLYTSCLQNKSK